jgi:hypothetical protein
LRRFLVLAFSLWLAWPFSPAKAANDKPAAGASRNGVCVVELFTSEGCSSCPPADELLLQIARDARQARRAVYPLAFHVDYWDNLGWKDPYGSGAYSKRQSDYVAAFGGEGAYTPEMVVNGRVGFVGSRREQAAQEIAKALAQPASAEVQIVSANPMPGGEVSVLVHVRGANNGDRVVGALVQREIEHHVGAGENSGRTLHHAEVVRGLATAPVRDGNVRLSLRASAELTRGKGSVVVFVQVPRTLAITGAARIDI